MLLFHGSKSDFTNFDPQYFRSGEGVAAFEGWYFSQHLKGAHKHIELYLKSISGYVYVCKVPDEIAVLDCESGFTESCYHGQAVGVRLEYSDRIQIIEKLPAINLVDEIVGTPKDYVLHTNKAPLKGGVLSFLRRNN